MYAGVFQNGEDCIQQCLMAKVTEPDIDSVTFAVNGFREGICNCYMNTTGVGIGTWLTDTEMEMNPFSTNQHFCALPGNNIYE